MTPDEATIRAAHVNGGPVTPNEPDICEECWQQWPCHTATLIKWLDEARAETATARAERDVAIGSLSGAEALLNERTHEAKLANEMGVGWMYDAKAALAREKALAEALEGVTWRCQPTSGGTDGQWCVEHNARWTAGDCEVGRAASAALQAYDEAHHD